MSTGVIPAPAAGGQRPISRLERLKEALIWRKSLAINVTREPYFRRWTAGTSEAATRPLITIAIMISMSVKPLTLARGHGIGAKPYPRDWRR